MLVAGFRDWGEIPEVAKHIRRLHHDAGCLAVNARQNILARRHIGRQRLNCIASHMRMGAHHVGVMGMQPA